jgi:ProQ/FINO family
MAALALARERIPEVFNDAFPYAPARDINRQLRELGISKAVAYDLLGWWFTQPGYRAADAVRKQHNASERFALIQRLLEMAPTVFNTDKPVPLAIGMGAQICGAGFTKAEVDIALRWWTRRREYQAALAADGSQRYNLDGIGRRAGVGPRSGSGWRRSR